MILQTLTLAAVVAVANLLLVLVVLVAAVLARQPAALEVQILAEVEAVETEMQLVVLEVQVSLF
tara:strand:- start:159 stop:350 length:192 start_codon:yes stop_codon:yes gene_type:complete